MIDLPAQVFHLTDAFSRGIPADAFNRRVGDLAGSTVLLHAGWDTHLGTFPVRAFARF